MAPSVEKKIAELEMGLLHLQQNIDIPEITLPVHQSVAAVIKRLNNIVKYLIFFKHFILQSLCINRNRGEQNKRGSSCFLRAT